MTTVCWDGNTLAADTLFTSGSRKMQGHYEKILLPGDEEWFIEGQPVMAVGFSGAVATISKVRKLMASHVVEETVPDLDGDSFSLIIITDKKVSYYWNSGFTASKEQVNEMFVVEGNHSVGSGGIYGLGVMAIKGDAISGVKAGIKIDMYSGGYVDVWSFETPRLLTRINPTTGEIISAKQNTPAPKKEDAILCAAGG